MNLRIYKIKILEQPNSKLWHFNKGGQTMFAHLTVKYYGYGGTAPCFRICDFDEERGTATSLTMCLDVSPEMCSIVKEFMISGESNISIVRKQKKYKYEKQD